MRTKSTMRNHATLLALGALLLLLCAPAAEAGVESVLARGFKPNVAYQVNEFDSVNTLNGNLMVNVPIGPTFETNGTLTYNFGLRYSGDFWTYISYHGINQSSSEPTSITIIDRDGGWDMYSFTVIDLGPSSGGGGDTFLGAEAIPTGTAGPGWSVAMESFGASTQFEHYRGGTYTDATGATHVFTPTMHTVPDCGTAGCTNTIAYTHDGSYLRMRLVNGDPLVREVDLPDGTVKHFRCVADCNAWNALWNLEWTADQFGNVLLVERTNGSGAPVVGRPPAGQWIWNYIEGTLPDGESRSDPYYHGTAADRAALKVTRRHRLTYNVENPNGRYDDYPWLLGVRLVRAELAGPHGDYSMSYSFEYQPKQILRTTIRPFILDPSLLVFPYNADKTINTMVLSSVTLPSGAGKWQFTYNRGEEADGENMFYEWCGDYTAPTGGCPPAQKYPTSRLAGRLESVRAPTGGGYKYEYGLRGFPRRPCFAQARSALEYGGGSMVAIRKRQQLDADGNEVAGAVWSYAGNGYFRTFIDADHDGWDDSDTDHSGDWNIGDALICRAPVEFLASTLDPNGLLTLNYYNLKFGDEWYGAPFSPEIDRADTLTRRDLSVTQRFLSSELYQVDMGNTSPFKADLANAVRRLFRAYRRNDPETTATLLRSTYATFEKSATDCDPTTFNCEFFNLRKVSEHTRFHDDPAVSNFPDGNNGTITTGAFIETQYGDFDGLGHFRQKNTYGNIRAVGRNNAGADDWDHRMEYTFFNPDVTWSPGQPNPSGLPFNWILDTYSHMSTMEPGWLVSSRHHFDSTRGYLRAIRRMKENGTNAGIPIPPSSGQTLVAATGPDDLLALFKRTGSTDDDGIPVVVTREENYGGDAGGLGGWEIGSNGTVTVPIGARRDYSIDTTTRAGAVAKVEYRTCDASQVYLKASSATIENGLGLALSATDSSGITTSYAYDALGRIINITPPAPLGAETYSYLSKTGTGGMNSVAVTRAGVTTTYVYDGFGRLTSESHDIPTGTSTSSFTYSATGKVLKQFLPFGSTGFYEYEYDVFDREQKATAPDRKFSTFAYSGIRSVVMTTRDIAGVDGAVNAQMSKAFDSFGRVWRVNDDAVRADYRYDAASNLIEATLDPVNVAALQHRYFHYDGRGILAKLTHPELREPGANGLQVVVKNSVDARGHVVATDLQWQGSGPRNLDAWRLRYDYDPAERLLEVWQPITNGRKTLKSFEFYGANDSPGRRAQLKKAVRRNYFPDPARSGGLPTIDVATTYNYSACTGTITQCSGLLANTVTAVTAPSANGTPGQSFFGGTVGYQYDSRGEISRIDYPVFADAPSRSIAYGYTKGFLTSVKDGGARRATIGYHANGLLKQVQLAADSALDIYTEDPSGINRPARIDWNWNGGSSSSGGYAYDGAGNLSAMGGDTFKYDKAMRLVRADVSGQRQSYAYDGFGNISTFAGQTLPVDWRTNRLGAPYLYDDAGNLKEMPDTRPLDPPVPGAKILFQYDAVKMLTSIDGQKLGHAFVYDAWDERIGIIDYKAAQGRLETWSLRARSNQVLRDFERTVTSSSSTWKWTRDYIYRGAVLSNTVAPPNLVRDVHTDHLGSVRFVTNANGQLVSGTSSGMRYWPFGGLVHKRPLDERLAFTGHERDDDGTASEDADLDYMHARYYRSAMGRFLSVDPALESVQALMPQSWNRYSYVTNNPLRYVDPTGREMRCHTIQTSNGPEEICAEEITVTTDDPYITPFQLGWEWLTGRGPRSRTFYDGDPITERLKEHEKIQEVAKAACTGQLDSSGKDRYNLGGLQGVPKYVRDYSTLSTGGLTGNLTVTYLGSYGIQYSTSNGSVQMTVTNSSSAASGLRPPVLGYTDWWGKNVGKPMNQFFASGPMSKTEQTFVFSVPCQ